MKTRVGNILAAIGICLVAVGLLQAGGDSAATTKAARLIQKEQKLIAFFAHPTGKLQTLQLVETKNIDGGFILTYQFNYKHPFGDFYSKIDFRFDGDGNYRTASPRASSGLTDAFDSANVVISWAKEELLKNPEFRDNKVVRDLIERADAKGLLGFMLKESASSL